MGSKINEHITPVPWQVKKISQTSLTSSGLQTGIYRINLKDALVTVEKLDDVCEVHVVLQDNVPVDFDQCKGNEEDKVTGRDTFGRPDGFPHGKHVVVHELWKTAAKARW